MNAVSARLAIAFGIVLAIGEVIRNVGDWQWWPFWLVDFLAAGLLIAAGVLTLRARPVGVPLLAGAWGFASAMFYMSFWSHLDAISGPSGGNIPHVPLTVIIGSLLLTAVVGFVLAVVPQTEPPAQRVGADE